MVIFLLYVAMFMFVATGFYIWRTAHETKEYMLLVFGGAAIIFGIFTAWLIVYLTLGCVSQKECSDKNISYELVQTTAEFTDKTEKEVLDFFVIMANAEVDSFDAVSYLAPELTDAEVSYIMTAADIKQKTAGH